jgi:Protein of unknown function (DUF3072)
VNPHYARSEKKSRLFMARTLLFIRHMSDQHQSSSNQQALQKDPDEWKTGDEPMTAAQRSYLETLSRETAEPFDETLTKAEASKRIDALRQRSPRVAGD